MAELVPNCSHVLHFSDEEIEYLQKIVAKKNNNFYESLCNSLDFNILKKYPPQNLKQPVQGFASYEIQNKEKLLKKLTDFMFDIEDGTLFSWTHRHFAYLLLIVMYERIEFPPFNDESYFIVYHYLQTMINNWYKKDFHYKELRLNNIFMPINIKNIPQNVKKIQQCFIL